MVGLMMRIQFVIITLFAKQDNENEYCVSALSEKYVRYIIFLEAVSGLSDFVTDEESLRASILGNYNINVRPKEKTEVEIGMSVFSLNTLDIGSQSMSSTIMLTITWQDHRLMWAPSLYGNITSIICPVSAIWTPPIIVDNSVSYDGIVGGNAEEAVPLEVFHDGLVYWNPIGEFTTSCEMRIAYYPFDTQSCSISVIGWAYTLAKINITIGAINLVTLYSPNGEWDLQGSRGYYNDLGSPTIESAAYRRVSLEVTYRRKWQFYAQNLMMPIVILSLLMNAVFLLPIDSGEKVGYSVTVLLSYTVFLTWVTENLPPTSTDTSILQIYLATVLMVGSLATLLTTWVLRLHHKPRDEPVAPVLDFLANRIFRPWHNCLSRKKNNKSTSGENENTNSKTKVRPLQINIKPSSSSHEKHASPKFTRKAHRIDADYFGIVAGKCAVSRETSDEPDLTWQELAVLFDYCFLWVFASILLIASVSTMTILYVNY